MKQLYFLFVLLLSIFITNAQTLVNRAWVDTTGHPAINVNYQSLAKDNSYVFVAGTSYELGVGDKFYVEKVNFYGVVQWYEEYNLASYNSLVATDLYIKGSYLYLTGTAWDSLNNKSNYLTLKLNYSDGSVVWYKQDTGSAGGYAAAIAVKVDDAGNVYVAGSEKANTSDYQMSLMKYNSSGTRQWVSYYDSVGFYDAATAMILKTGLVEVTGFSGNGFSSWDFVTCRFDDSTGALTYTARSGNGNGSFSQPVGIAQDYSSNTIICGTATIAGANTDIKIIKYDTAFNEIWVSKWGNSDSLADVAASMERDVYSNYAVTGTVTKTNGGKDIVTLRYDASGTLLWSRTISAPDPTKQAIANRITTDASLNIYVTGKIDNGSDYDFVTFSYDASGNMRWYKTYDGGTGYNDEGFNIVADGSGNVYVSGKSAKDTVSHFVTIKYEQWSNNLPIIRDTASKALYVKKRVLVRFNENAIKKETLLNRDFVVGNPSVFLTDSAYIHLAEITPFDLSAAKMVRLTSLNPADSFSVSRLGIKVKVPPLWAAFALDYSSSRLNEVEVADSLHILFPTTIIYAHPDYVGQFDVGATDPDYNLQGNLHVISGYDSANINIESAWNYGGGEAFVKVGIIDDGTDYNNADLGGGQTIKIKGGKDYTFNGSSIFVSPSGTGSHGTNVAGIIGASSNNGNAVAGIAGGFAGSTTGASLCAFKIANSDTQLLVSNMYAAIVENAIDNSNHPANAAWGLHIMNISMGFDSAFTIYSDSNILLLQDAVHFADRNQVTIVASRGNLGDNQLHYPACYFDPWVMSVAASGDDGHLAQKIFNTGGCPSGYFGYNSSFGRNTDILAPGARCIVKTTATGTTLSTGFDGTSAAAPHVTGVAALLMSHYNTDTPSINNLAPEDIQVILQQTATDIGLGIGNNISNSGRLNAGAAFDWVWRPKHKLEHIISYGADSVFLESFNNIVQVPYPIQNMNGEWIDKGTYYADRVELYKTFYIQPTAPWRVVTMWPVHSLSDVTFSGLAGNALMPFELIDCCETLSSLNDDTVWAFASGSTWLLTDTINGGTHSWWYPYSQTYATDSSKWALSVLYNDTSISSIKESELIAFGISAEIYPNPSQDNNTIVITAEKPANIQIDLYDIIGRRIRNVYQGKIESGDNHINSTLIDLANGSYLYRIYNKETGLSRKFIKFH